MSRKLQLFSVVFLVFLLLFSPLGCGKKNDDILLDPKNPVTIELWHYYSGKNHEEIEAAADEFNKTIGIEKGVVVNPVRIPSIEQLETAAEESAKGVVSSQPMPHLFSSYPDVAFTIDELGMLVDYRDYFTTEELASYVPDFLADGVYSDGRQLLIPVAKSTELFYLNDTAFQEFSTATGYTYQDFATWESVVKVAKAYYEWTDSKTPNTPWDGKAFLGFDSVANYIIVGNRQLGVEIIHSNEDGTGEAVLNRKNLRKIFDAYFTPHVLGYFGYYAEFRADDLKQGDIISYVASSSGASYFPTHVTDGTTLVEMDFKAFSYPMFEGSEHFAVQQGAGFCIAKTDPVHQLGAAEFVRWFTSGKQNLNFVMSTGYLPVQEQAFYSDIVLEKIEALHHGDKSEQIIAKVYDISLDQIVEKNTYAAKPFAGSYDVRSTVEKTLMSLTDDAFQKAKPLKEQGHSAEEILEKIDVDEYFETWLTQLKSEFDDLNIKYVEQND